MINKFKRIIACMLVFILMSSDMTALAEGVIKTMKLPAALQIISEEAFCGNTSIGKVVVPEGTEKILSRAFADSSLTEIELPDSLTFIAEDAFEGCGSFAVSVSEGSYAYNYCVQHGYINLAADFETEMLEDGTLSITGYQGTASSVVIPAMINGVSVTDIASFAFSDCGQITSIIVPEGIKTIGELAFNNCAELSQISLPSSLVSIGDLAFQSCALRSIVIPEGVQELGWNIFNNNLELKETVIPTSVKTVDKTPITWNEEGTGFSVGGDISSYMFYHWTEIEEVTVLDGCTSIGEGAWMECSSLQRVSLPESVTSMSSRVFADCWNLVDVNIPSKVALLEEFVFSSCSFEKIALPQSLETIGENAFQMCGNLKEAIIPDGTKRIADRAFAVCQNLLRVRIPATVVEIDGDIFEYGNSDVVIVASQDAYAIEYAIKMGYNYEIETMAPIPVSAIDLNENSLQLMVGESVALSATVLPADATNKTLNWTTDAEYIAMVDKDGVITAKGVGTAVITVTAADGSGKTDNCTVTTELAVPANVKATPLGSDSIEISWSKVEGAEAYEVYYTEDEAGKYSYVDTTMATTLVHDDLMCNTTYYYKVCAISGTHASEDSDVVYTATQDQLVSLNAPENLTVSTLNEYALHLSWDDVDGAEGYYVICDGTVIAEIAGSNNCSYEQEDLAADTTYEYAVKAYAYKNNGDEVTGPACEACAGKTAAVLSVEATVANCNLTLLEVIIANATVIGNYNDYTLRYTVKKGTEVVSVSGECTTTQYSYAPAEAGTYSMIVVATDSLGRSASSQIDNIIVQNEKIEITQVAIDKNVAMVGETVVITADGNYSDQLSYSANVYRNDVKTDSIIGVGQLLYTPDETGVYSFTVNITDAYGEIKYFHLNKALTVVPYWAVDGISLSAETALAGDKVTCTIATQGKTGGVTFTYVIYKDEQEYRRVDQTSDKAYSFTANDPGIYRVECLASDAYNHTVQVTSTNLTVTRSQEVNSSYDTATVGNALKLEELNGKSSSDVMLEKDDITVTWDKLANDSYYELEIGCSKLQLEVIYDEEYTKNSFTIPASMLQEGYEYYIDLIRFDASGNKTGYLETEFVVLGGESLNLEDIPRLIVPAKRASVVHDDLIIQWKQMNYADTINIILEYNCGCDDHEILRETVDGKTTTYTIPKEILQPGKEHDLRIVAYDKLGYSKKNSHVFYVGCEGDDDLFEITDPVLTSDFLYAGNRSMQTPTYPAYEPVVLTWNQVPAAEWYSVELRNKKTNETQILDNIKTNYYSIQPETLVSGNVYEVCVYAHHTAECYRESEDLWFRAPYKGNLVLDPPVVTVPDLSKDINDPTVLIQQDLTVEWEPVTAAKTYYVKLCQEDDGNSYDFEADGLTEPKVMIPRSCLEPEYWQTLYVYAYDADGNTTCQEYYLKAVSSTIGLPVLVSPELSLDRDNMPAYEEKDMTLVWGAVEDAAYYRVVVRDLQGSTWEKILGEDVIGAETFTIPEEELYESGQFKVRIIAYDEYGNCNGGLREYYFRVGSPAYLNLTVTDWIFDYEGGSKTFFINTSEKWTASCSDPWISLSKTSGNSSMQLSVRATENTDDFPRSGSVTFTNAAGGCAVFSVTQNGNGAANSGSLSITTPTQGDTLDYAGFRVNWKYKYDHAYFNAKLYDATSGETVYEKDQIITYYADVPQSALTYGHVYQLTVAVYNAQYSKISESSIVFRVESLATGGGTGTDGGDDGILDDTEIPEGATEIKYAGIADGDSIDRRDITVSWQNVLGADSYWVALRDLTVYPDETPETNVVKIIDEETELLMVTIHEGQLTEGHSYRLWIAAHKEDETAPITGKNIVFTVKNNADGGDTPGSSDTLISTATLTLASNQVALGDSVALSGKVLANGGILDQVRITVQDAQTGEYCDYAIYDAAAIGSFGYYDQFDLANVYPIITGEGTYIGTSGSGYARADSTSLYLDTAGDKYNIVVYGKNNGDSGMYALASAVITLSPKEEAKWTTSYDTNYSNITVSVSSGVPEAGTAYLFIAEDANGAHHTGYIAAGQNKASFGIKELQMPRAAKYDLYVLPSGVALTDTNRSKYFIDTLVLPLWNGNMISAVYSGGTNVTSTKQPYIDEDIDVIWEGSYGVYDVEVTATLNGTTVFTKKYTDPEQINADKPVTTTIGSSYFSNAKVGDKMVITVTVMPTDEAQAVLTGAGLDPTISKSWKEGTFVVGTPSVKYASIYDSKTQITYDKNNPLQLIVGDHNYRNGYDLRVELENDMSANWTVYTDNVDVARAYRTEDGKTYVHAKKRGTTMLYISDIYADDMAKLDSDRLYAVCRVNVSMDGDELQGINQDFAELYQYYQRENCDEINAGYYSFVSFFPSAFYMGVIDGVKYDASRVLAHVGDTNYEGDILAREMLMQKTLEFDELYFEAMQYLQTTCEAVTWVDDALNEANPFYDVVKEILDENWTSNDFDNFLFKVQEFEKQYHISDTEELFARFTKTERKVYQLFGTGVVNSTRLSKLQEVCYNLGGKFAKLMNTGIERIKVDGEKEVISYIECVGDILSVSQAVIQEYQWECLEDHYKASYIATLDEWIELESDEQMKAAYRQVRNAMTSELAGIVDFLDKTVIKTGVAYKYGSFFLNNAIQKEIFGKTVKKLWVKLGTKAGSSVFSKAVAIVEFANIVSEGALLFVSMTGIDMTEVKKVSVQICQVWDAYDKNVDDLTIRLTNINKDNYRVVIAKMELCLDHLKHLMQLIGKDFDGRWDFVISPEEVEIFRDNMSNLFIEWDKIIVDYEELLEEYFQLN